MEPCSETFDAIGVTNQVVVDSEDAIDRALEIARAEVRALDDACSRFRDDSELAAVNRAAGTDVTVGPLLLAVVEAALRTAAATDGLVDPTVGPALGALGYDRDFRLVPGATPRTLRLIPAAGWRRVRVDRRRATIRIPRGAELDLGAIAKAFSADRIAARIHASTGANALVSLGGDIAVAGAPPGGWAVTVTDDHRRDDGHGQVVGIADGGLATSSTRCGAGAPAAASSTTSSTRRADFRPPSAGARSASPPRRASTPTAPPRPRSSWARLLRRGSTAWGSRPASSGPTAP